MIDAKLKQNIRIKENVLGCHLGWIDRRFGQLFTETWQPRTYFLIADVLL